MFVKETLKNVSPEVWIAVGVLFFAFLVNKVIKKVRYNLPPGPTGLPIFGYLPFLTKFPHLKFMQLSKKYGDVFGFYMGSKYVVVLNDADSIREAFSKWELLARPPNTLIALFNITSHSAAHNFQQSWRPSTSNSLINFQNVKAAVLSDRCDTIRQIASVFNMNNGSVQSSRQQRCNSGIETPFFTTDFHMWQEQRKFVIHSLKDLGLGKSKIEGHIQDEIQHFLNVLKESNSQPMNLENPLTPSISNNICSLVFGERLEYTDPSRNKLDHVLNNIPRNLTQTSVFMFFPWMKYIPFLSKIFKYESAFDSFKWFYRFIEEKVYSHKETLDSSNTRDFIDSYLTEMKIRKNSGLKTSMSDETLKGSIFTLFGAGSETVRSTVSWTMYTMASFPEVQKKVQKEIQEVLGSSRCPELLDQRNMKYTEAVIREVMRWQNVAPLSIFRYTLGDVKVAGYDIPKETMVTGNLWAVLHDPRYWKDPESFRPERFLDERGNIIKDNHFMPFSVGKRSCPGETMAFMEIFLYFVSILQKFQVVFPAGFQPTFEGELGITYHVNPYKICFVPK